MKTREIKFNLMLINVIRVSKNIFRIFIKSNIQIKIHKKITYRM